MDQELQAVLERLASVRLAERMTAFRALCRCSREYYSVLIDALDNKKFDENEDYVPGFGSVKQSIWRALLKNPTPRVLGDLARLARYKDWEIREAFASDIGELGMLRTISLLRKLLHDEDSMVRDAAARGLLTPARNGCSRGFARAATKLLVNSLREIPGNEWDTRHLALEEFSPKDFAEFDAELDRKNPMRVVWKRIHAIADRHNSYKAAAAALHKTRPMYAWIFAISYVDADLRNGGIYQLYANPTWQLMIPAIEGAKAFEFTDLAKALREILYYYHRNGRSKLARQIPADFFSDVSKRWNKSLAALEKQYYQCFDRLGVRDTDALEQRILRDHPELLDEQ